MGAEAASRPALDAGTAAGGGTREERRWAWPRLLARHPGWCLLGIALATAALWFSHLPSLLLHAQFYADDGIWYRDAYSQGPLSTLFQPDAGYLVLLQRLGAALSLLLPTALAPTLFNLVALLVEVGGICYLVSSRMASAIPSTAARLLIAVLVIVLPNAYDTSGNLTNAQWHLALIAFLVVFAGRPARRWGWLCDGVVLVVSGLTGPYSILLEPIAAWRWLRDRGDRHRLAVLAANSAVAAVQVGVLLTSATAERLAGALAAGPLTLVTLLGRQVTLGLVVGAHGLAGLAGSPLEESALALTLLAAIPVAACAGAAWRGPAILRGFCLFAALELALALISPAIPPPRWPDLGTPADVVAFHPGALRYFLYPLLAFALSLGWLVADGLRRERRRRRSSARERGLRRVGDAGARAAVGVAGLLLLVTAVDGVPRDWVYPPYLDLHWDAQVQRLEAAAPGTTVVIPLNPEGWTMTLVAR